MSKYGNLRISTDPYPELPEGDINGKSVQRLKVGSVIHRSQHQSLNIENLDNVFEDMLAEDLRKEFGVELGIFVTELDQKSTKFSCKLPLNMFEDKI